MSRFYQRYLAYRRVGFNRMDAFRFAWLVEMAGVKPAAIRVRVRR